MRKLTVFILLCASLSFSKTEIYRDAYGVPHIFAANEAEALRALGWMMARDRMFVMDGLRRISTASVSKLIGPLGVSVDRQYIPYGFKQSAEVLWKGMDPSSRKLLASFVKGVNDAIAKGEYSHYFYDKLKITPDPFTPTEVLAMASFVSFMLQDTVDKELLFYAMFQQLGKTVTEKVIGLPLPDLPKGHPIETGSTFFPNLFSSNNWAVSAKRTKDKESILAGDPHVLLSQPPLFYEAHIKVRKKWEIYGVTVAGFPLFLIGFTPHIAFSATSSWADVGDIIRYPYDSKRKLFYDGADWVPIQKEKQVLSIKGGRTKKIMLYKTPEGNVLRKEKDALLVFKFAPNYANRDIVSTAFRILKAKSVAQARLLFASLPAPAANFAMADNTGHIALQLSGLIPVRQGSYPYFPAPPGAVQWEGFIPVEKLPHYESPPSGFVYSANEHWYKSFPTYISVFTSVGFRAARIRSVLASRKEWDLESVFHLQDDTYSLLGDAVLGSILPLMIEMKETHLLAERLSRWDRRCEIDSNGCALFHILLQNLIKNILKDDLKNFYKPFLKQGNYLTLKTIMRVLEHPEVSILIDDKTTPAEETLPDILKKSVQETMTTLEEKYQGIDTQWGAVHRINFGNLFEKIGLKGKAVNEPIKGGLITVFRSDYELDAPYGAVLGAPFRFAVQLGKKPNAIALLGPGNQENPFAPHAYDQLKRWLAAKPRKVVLEKKKIVALAEEKIPFQ